MHRSRVWRVPEPTAANRRRRFRLTTHLPLTGDRIGLTLWFGSLDSGWTGWPVFKRGRTWTISGVKPDA